MVSSFPQQTRTPTVGDATPEPPASPSSTPRASTTSSTRTCSSPSSSRPWAPSARARRPLRTTATVVRPWQRRRIPQLAAANCEPGSAGRCSVGMAKTPSPGGRLCRYLREPLSSGSANCCGCRTRRDHCSSCVGCWRRRRSGSIPLSRRLLSPRAASSRRSRGRACRGSHQLGFQ